MTKQEIALQLTLKMIGNGEYGGTKYENDMTRDDYNTELAKGVAVIFNAFMNSLCID